MGEGNKRNVAVELWNTYQRDLQADESGETWLTIVAFDDKIEVWEDGTPIRQAQTMTHQKYEPRGMTAMNDSIAHAITLADAQLEKLGRDDVKVLIPVLTDGLENVSREYPAKDPPFDLSNDALKALIAAREATGYFTFVWLSADPTASRERIAQDYGVALGNVATFDYSSASGPVTAAALSSSTRGLRSNAKAGQTMSYFEDAGNATDLRDEKGEDAR